MPKIRGISSTLGGILFFVIVFGLLSGGWLLLTKTTFLDDICVPPPPPWRGPDGESMEEFVEDGYDPLTDSWYIVVGTDGHKIRLHNNPKATDPTYKELLEFLARDKTEQIPYDPDKFVCADYAEVLHNNAENVGIRAAYVCMGYTGFTGHAFNAFRTVDKGLVYIDMAGGCDSTADIDGCCYQLTPLFSDVEFLPEIIMGSPNVQW